MPFSSLTLIVTLTPTAFFLETTATPANFLKPWTVLSAVLATTSTYVQYIQTISVTLTIKLAGLTRLDLTLCCCCCYPCCGAAEMSDTSSISVQGTCSLCHHCDHLRALIRCFALMLAHFVYYNCSPTVSLQRMRVPCVPPSFFLSVTVSIALYYLVIIAW